jgi:DNA-binding PadR family transcriptional regulator
VAPEPNPLERERSASLAERQARGRGAEDQPGASVWLVLALVIEQSSHGYELSQRYQRRFGAFLPMSVPRVYGALDRLREGGMIELISPKGGKSAPRQHMMRRSYRVTDAGVEAYRRWVAERMRDDPQRPALLGRITSAGLLGIDGVLDVIDRYQRECMEELRALPADDEQLESGRSSLEELTESLVVDQQRRELRARYEWAVNARDLLEAHKSRAQEQGASAQDAPSAEEAS